MRRDQAAGQRGEVPIGTEWDTDLPGGWFPGDGAECSRQAPGYRKCLRTSEALRVKNAGRRHFVAGAGAGSWQRELGRSMKDGGSARNHEALLLCEGVGGVKIEEKELF